MIIKSLTIDQILAEWDMDKIIPYDNLAVEALKVPVLHNKYYKILLDNH